MEGETYINGKRVDLSKPIEINGIWRPLAHRADVVVSELKMFGGKTRIAIGSVSNIGTYSTGKPILLDVGEKPVKVGLRLFGGVVIQRVAPKQK